MDSYIIEALHRLQDLDESPTNTSQNKIIDYVDSIYRAKNVRKLDSKFLREILFVEESYL